MRRFCLFVALPLACLLVVAVAVWWHLAETINPIPADEEAARQQVAAALPLGSTRKQVEAWLAAKWIGVDNFSQVVLTARKDYLNWRGNSGDLWMEFYFDEQGRLTRSNVYIELVSL
jgi:hypothetical protein